MLGFDCTCCKFISYRTTTTRMLDLRARVYPCAHVQAKYNAHA